MTSGEQSGARARSHGLLISGILALAGSVVLAAAVGASGATTSLAYTGCITGNTSLLPGACAEIASAASAGTHSGLDLPTSLALSPDGTSLYLASAYDDAVARFKRDTTSGVLTYKGCITGRTAVGPTGSGACTEIPSATADGDSGLTSPSSLALSADGKWLYVAAAYDDAVARFRRNTTSGALTYRGCITGETESGPAGSGACAAIPSAASLGAKSGLDRPLALALSADGSSLYVSDYGAAVAHFRRDTSAGGLVWKGCITGAIKSGPAGSGACTAIPSATSNGTHSGLAQPGSLALSRDGASLYVASMFDSAIARFKRNPTSGALIYKGCITGQTETGSGGSGACATIPTVALHGTSSGLADPGSLALSPDGSSLYVASHGDSAVARFRRSTTSGALTYKGCISGDSYSGPSGSGACTQIASAGPNGWYSGLGSLAQLTVSPDGASLYTASNGDDAIARFSRNTTSGALTYRRCVTADTRSGPDGSGACAQITSATGLGTNSGLNYPWPLALSPDGNSLYVSSQEDDAVASFDP